jgi:hypothetical protein
MFKTLAQYDSILVTGPQRSGTRIAAKMIAHDTGRSYVDETDIFIDSLYSAASVIARGNCVLQCPSLCRYVHNLVDEETLVVMMFRDVDAIIDSQARVGWEWELIEQVRYQNFTEPIAVLKYRTWKNQKQVIPRYVELNYADLRLHPLWIGAELRKGFAMTQTEVAP